MRDKTDLNSPSSPSSTPQWHKGKVPLLLFLFIYVLVIHIYILYFFCTYVFLFIHVSREIYNIVFWPCCNGGEVDKMSLIQGHGDEDGAPHPPLTIREVVLVAVASCSHT